MIVSFNTRKLRDICASLEQAEAEIGATHAQELIALISDADSVETAAELIELYDPEAMEVGNAISLPVGARYRASFVALGAAAALDSGVPPDWHAVRRLKMMDLTSC